MHNFWPKYWKFWKLLEFIFLKLEYFQSWKLAIVRSQGQDLALFGFQFNELLSLLVESLFCQAVWVFLVTQTKVSKKTSLKLRRFLSSRHLQKSFWFNWRLSRKWIYETGITTANLVEDIEKVIDENLCPFSPFCTIQKPWRKNRFLIILTFATLASVHKWCCDTFISLLWAPTKPTTIEGAL